MESDEFQALIKLERERRKTPREHEIQAELMRIGEKHQAACQAEMAPLLAELTKIEMQKPPLPILHEGQVYRFAGDRLGLHAADNA